MTELGRIVYYCENSDCAAREVTVELKYYERDVIPTNAPCPMCHRALKPHYALTHAQARAADDRDARWSVNFQRAEKRSIGGFVRLSDVTDELP